jgi:adenosine/AMP kinase
MELITVRIEKPEATNFVLGQTHFIKSVEDIHKALVGAVPGIKFGLAFCEASGKCLVRWSDTDETTSPGARASCDRSTTSCEAMEDSYPGRFGITMMPMQEEI